MWKEGTNLILKEDWTIQWQYPICAVILSLIFGVAFYFIPCRYDLLVLLLVAFVMLVFLLFFLFGGHKKSDADPIVIGKDGVNVGRMNCYQWEDIDNVYLKKIDYLRNPRYYFILELKNDNKIEFDITTFRFDRKEVDSAVSYWSEKMVHRTIKVEERVEIFQ